MQQGTAPCADGEAVGAATLDVAAYIRVSTAEQKGKYGIPAQARAIGEFVAQRSSWRLVESHEDIGASGSNDSRPRLDALLDDISWGRWNSSWCTASTA
ncbi:recombinase family protein [Streptomyces sp. NPDC054813]